MFCNINIFLGDFWLIDQLMTERLIVWLIDWLNDWLIDRLIDFLGSPDIRASATAKATVAAFAASEGHAHPR